MAFKDKETAAAYNKTYKAVWYKQNKERLIARTAERRKELRSWFFELKKSLKCQRCSFSHPAALDFHHRDETLKEGCVSEMVSFGHSKARILREIEKCEVLCANCHRILHHDDGAFV